LWEEIQRSLIDAVRELNRVVEQIQFLVDNRSSESLEAVSNSILRANAAFERSNELSPGYSLLRNIRTIEERDTNYASVVNEGEFWTIGWGRKTIRLKNSKGVRLLAVLIDNPGRQFHVVDLERYERKDEPDCGDAPLVPSDAGPMLDDSAKTSYRARLRDLRDELKEAEGFNDIFRVSKIREEMAILTKELARAFGLYGESRLAISSSERARVRVTLAVKGAIGKISGYNPAVGWHLATSVKTGSFCLYLPAPIAKDGDSFQGTDM
ncbi:MAG: hypothetical protein ACREQN_06765, partial [Candidatus Binataceae bacterium]